MGKNEETNDKNKQTNNKNIQNEKLNMGVAAFSQIVLFL